MDRRAIALTLALIAAIAVPLCVSSGWARGLGVLGLGGGAAVAAPEINCTGSEAFLRGSNASGNTESFEMGIGDTCASDWTVTGSTGIDTYSTGWYLFGSHSLALTDDSGTTANSLRADHGSAQTSHYYRVYVRVPDIPTNSLFQMFGPGKYNTGASIIVSIYDISGVQKIRIGTGTEYINVTAGEYYRIELSVVDADGSGVGGSTYILKAWDSAGSPMETTNGGGDVEINATSTTDQFRYFHITPELNSATAATIYMDGVKNCNTWCGAE